MFQGLRAGSPLFILHKTEPKIEIGEVLSVSNPIPMYPTSFNGNSFMPQMTVDVKVKTGQGEFEFQKLRSDLCIADTQNGSVVVSDNRDAIIGEIENFRKMSERALEDMPKHQHIVDECKKMMSTISPSFVRDEKQAEDIENLKKDVSGLQLGLDDIKKMLSRALGQSPNQNEE